MTKSHHPLCHLKECPFLLPFRLLWALRPVFLNESANHTFEEGIAQNLRGGRPPHISPEHEIAFRTFDKSSDRVKIIPGIFREIVLPIPPWFQQE